MYEKLYIYIKETCRCMLLELIDCGCSEADVLLEDFYTIDCLNPEFFLYYYDTIKDLYKEFF